MLLFSDFIRWLEISLILLFIYQNQIYDFYSQSDFYLSSLLVVIALAWILVNFTFLLHSENNGISITNMKIWAYANLERKNPVSKLCLNWFDKS